ncbi:hypothetical protein BGZ82_002245, partial [Podila clonocystis]
MKMYLDKDNEYHQEFYEVINKIRSVIKKKIDKDTGKKNDVQIRGMYNLVDDEKEITGYALTVRLIESKGGDMYTGAYDDEGQVDIKEV